MAKARPANLADVVRRADVSTASVSRVLAGKSHVSGAVDNEF